MSYESCVICKFKSIKIHPEGTIKADKNMLSDRNYDGIQLPVSKADYSKIDKKNNICINVFCFENNLFCPVHISDQKFTDCLNLLLITDYNKSHYVYIKDFNRYIFNKLINKNKKHFCKYCLQCFITEKENCLKINGKQSVKLRIDTIKFKNH